MHPGPRCSICRENPATLRAVPAERSLRELPDGTPVGPNEVVVRHAPDEDVLTCDACFDANASKFVLAFALDTPEALSPRD